LYVINRSSLYIFNLQFGLLSSFSLSIPQINNPMVKVDQNVIYITITGHNQIYVSTKQGKLKKCIGSISPTSKDGEFIGPRGITVASHMIYICDYFNSRIQALKKNNNYSFSKKWGTSGT